ncbi:MAG: 2-dehydropantoate 2-reductase [Xanthomonadaceae bacterium]|nr:2-dehydropantoate 2-reductase [Xanthomonadaceae bacterium]MDE1965575.1 2-dehydropantoate 2-reductase [Xanthomonadaceae bacterium]
MRMLVLGAGGTGGYFGGRLAQSGADVTFLVRETRAAQLARDGLVIRSPLGDARIAVQYLTAPQLPAAAARPFDVVLLSCKAYDLDSSVDAIAPAVGEGTAVWPILNGLKHYEALDERFGAHRVLGGLCFISATKNEDGEVLHLGRPASVTFGEREGDPRSARCQALADAFAAAGVEFHYPEHIAGDQWIKFTFLTALAGATCLMRASIGDIVAAEGGRAFVEGLYDECLAVAEAAGQPIPAEARDKALGMLTQAGSRVTASMLRDLEGGQRTEGAHIVGDMLRRSRAAGQAAPRLELAWVHLQAHEARRRAG